jgi:hypothetical protein
MSTIFLSFKLEGDFSAACAAPSYWELMIGAEGFELKTYLSRLVAQCQDL